MRKNIYVREELIPYIKKLMELEKNPKSFSNLIDYLVRKEYRYFEKYYKKDMEVINEQHVISEEEQEQIDNEIKKLREERRKRKEVGDL